MAARTPLTVTQLAQDGAVTAPAGDDIDAANGMTIPSPTGPNGILLQVTATAAGNVTVRAGGSGLSADGSPAKPVPFDGASAGDLVVAAPAGTVFLGPFTSDRFTQADGSLSVDFDPAVAGTIAAIELPYGGIRDAR